MICKHCQQDSNPASRVCPFCGQYMGQEAPAYEPLAPNEAEELNRGFQSRQQTQRKTGKPPRRKRQTRRRRLTKKDTYQSRMINWVKVGLVVGILAIFLAAGTFIWLNATPQGQLIMARMGRDANADAFWALGTEYLDQGYINRSIETYLKAEEKQKERPDLADKLLLLAEAYEAAGRTQDAEEVYKRIYEQLKPEDPVAYRNALSILLSENRQAEAVSLMQTAYEKTKDEAFFNQRSQLVPRPPTASLTSGRHMFSKTVEFLSDQGYEIYYTTGEGELPETGERYREPITLNEGTYNFRAVCVSSELTSDEMTIRYTITLPNPMAPKTNMESKTYARPIKVSLRVVDEEDKEVELYYTIDGTKPSTDSPQYTGEPILIQSGRTFLRAIAVNRYGKVSNEMNVEYKVEGGFKKFFRDEDQFSDFALQKTDQQAFYQKFGQPESEEEITDDALSGPAIRALYPWGEARFNASDASHLLYRVTTNATTMTGPRGSKVGMQMKEVTDRFRDMGQVPNKRGDRGIYYDLAEGYARYTAANDEPMTGKLEYVFVGGPLVQTTRFTSQIENGRVESMTIEIFNRRLSLVQ